MAKLGRVLGRSHYSLCDLLRPDYGQTIIAPLTRPRVVRLESLDQAKPRLAVQVGRYAGVNNCEPWAASSQDWKAHRCWLWLHGLQVTNRRKNLAGDISS